MVPGSVSRATSFILPLQGGHSRTSIADMRRRSSAHGRRPPRLRLGAFSSTVSRMRTEKGFEGAEAKRSKAATTSTRAAPESCEYTVPAAAASSTRRRPAPAGQHLPPSCAAPPAPDGGIGALGGSVLAGWLGRRLGAGPAMILNLVVSQAGNALIPLAGQLGRLAVPALVGHQLVGTRSSSRS
jgi:hypothetical protein